MIKHLWTLIYPAACAVCGAKHSKAGLCADCAASIKKVNPVGNRIRHEKEGVYYNRVWSCGVYEGALKKAIGAFKYKKRPSLARVFSGLLLGFARDTQDIRGFEVVVPVPLSGPKLRERQFNQARLLAEPIAKEFGIRFLPGKLERTKTTRSQSNLKRKRRLMNLKGAFSMRDGSAVSGKDVLLVDDVFTTGTTANECAKVLIRSGARSVSVLTLARGE